MFSTFAAIEMLPPLSLEGGRRYLLDNLTLHVGYFGREQKHDTRA